MSLNESQRIISCVSMFSSLLVAATCISFQTMRQNFFARIILMIAVCDVIVSGVGIIGFPSGGSTLCVVQAAISTFFLRANWFWTSMLVFQIYRFVIFNKMFLSEKVMHGWVWIFSAVLTFLPLIHASFGRAGDYSTTELCFLTSSDYNWVTAWILIDWFCTVYACILFMSAIIARVYCQYLELRNNSNHAKFSEAVMRLVTNLYVYPLIMLLTWGTNTMCNVATLKMVSSNKASEASYIVGSTNVTAMANGILLGAAFFYKSSEARYQWRRLFYRIAGSSGGDKDNFATHTNLDYGDTLHDDRESTFVTELSIVRPASSDIVFNPQLCVIDEFDSFSRHPDSHSNSWSVQPSASFDEV